MMINAFCVCVALQEFGTPFTSVGMHCELSCIFTITLQSAVFTFIDGFDFLEFFHLCFIQTSQLGIRGTLMSYRTAYLQRIELCNGLYRLQFQLMVLYSDYMKLVDSLVKICDNEEVRGCPHLPCVVSNVQCAIYVMCSVRNVQCVACNVSCVQCNVQCLQCNVYCVVRYVYCVMSGVVLVYFLHLFVKY